LFKENADFNFKEEIGVFVYILFFSVTLRYHLVLNRHQLLAEPDNKTCKP